MTLGLLGGAYWLSRNGDLWDRFGPLPDFTTDGMPDGFHKLVTSADGLSAGLADPFAGITVPGAEQSEPAFTLNAQNMDAVLFETPARSDLVRLAYFTDYNCPYCRVLGKELNQLGREEENIHISWQEMPLLGETSELGARAAIAARVQDAYLPFHRRLNTGIVRINRDYIRTISDDLSLNFNQLERDMFSAQTSAKLAQAMAVREAFGVIGTPFLLVERIAINGRVSMPMLRRLIALERSA